MRHTATPDGELVSFEARIVLDGGAYRSSSYHVAANAACFAAGPVPRAERARATAIAVRTNNPPCGAMRGFGVVQVVLRPRGADGPARRGVRHRPGRAAPAQRARARATSCSPASASRARCRSRRSSATCAALPLPDRPPTTTARPARRRGPHGRRGRRAARRRLRGRLQEPHVRRGLHGRLDRALPASTTAS